MSVSGQGGLVESCGLGSMPDDAPSRPGHVSKTLQDGITALY